MPVLQWDCFTFILNSWNPLGHARPVLGLLYLYLNFLETSGPRQACNVTDLNIPYIPGTLWAMSRLNGNALPSP